MSEETNSTPHAEPKPATVTIEYKDGNFRSKIEGEIPIIPLMGTLVLQVISLAMNQIAHQQQRAREEQLLQAKRSTQLLFPDGTPIPPQG